MADQNSDEWRAFGKKLIKERKQTQPTTLASASFVKRMTSSAADPDAAEAQGEGEPLPAPVKRK